ncbi:bifunctional pyr operon transcriptional regulator/uracil phosphoribosyltransferase PyrR [[Clostridium] cellulosi]|jgi:Phosphoribosyl transferase domain.
MREKAEIMDEKAIFRAVARIAYEIVERNHGAQDLCVIGIKRRGAVLAKLIAEKIYEVEKTSVKLGYLDITPFRDDLKSSQLPNEESEIPFDVVNQNVVLVDDVIYTGRSVRAAIDAIMKKGRPKRIQLAVLVDRGHRELPIRADFVGKNVPTSRNESVEVMVTEYDGVNRVAIFDNGGEDDEYRVS